LFFCFTIDAFYIALPDALL